MIVCVKLLISFKKEDSAIYYNIEKPEIMLREISQTKKNLTLFMYRIKKKSNIQTCNNKPDLFWYILIIPTLKILGKRIMSSGTV